MATKRKTPIPEEIDDSHGFANTPPLWVPPADAMPEDHGFANGPIMPGLDPKRVDDPIPVAPTYSDRIKAATTGGYQGFKEFIDPQAEWLARTFGGNPLTDRLGMPNAGQVTAADLATKQAYDKQYGDNINAQIGREVGKAAGAYAETSPIRAVMAPIAGARMVGPYLSRGVDVASNALQGATASALEGGDPTTGAAVGGAAGVAGAGLSALGRSNLLQRIADHPMTRLASDIAAGFGGYHYAGDPLHGLASFFAADQVLNKFGKDLIIPATNKLLKGAGGVLGQSGSIAGEIAGQPNIAKTVDDSGLYPIYDRLGRIIGHSKTKGTATGE